MSSCDVATIVDELSAIGECIGVVPDEASMCFGDFRDLVRSTVKESWLYCEDEWLAEWLAGGIPSRVTLSGVVLRPSHFVEPGHIAWMRDGEVVAVTVPVKGKE